MRIRAQKCQVANTIHIKYAVATAFSSIDRIGNDVNDNGPRGWPELRRPEPGAEMDPPQFCQGQSIASAESAGLVCCMNPSSQDSSGWISGRQLGNLPLQPATLRVRDSVARRKNKVKIKNRPLKISGPSYSIRCTICAEV